jgi:DNA-binding LacI/PurR family transcriptional regulator
VAGVPDFVHTVQRMEAFRRAAKDLGIWAEIVPTDYTAESGARATQRLLSRRDPPTAILYDSDLLAVTGLGVTQQMGFSVPDDVSIVGWDDSLLSRVVHPPLTAMTRDIVGYGVSAAKHLLRAVDGRATEDVEVPAGVLTLRGSTARALRATAARPDDRGSVRA